MDIYVFRETRCARSLYELCFRFLFARGDEGDVKWVSAEKSLPNGRAQQLLRRLDGRIARSQAELEGLKQSIRAAAEQMELLERRMEHTE